MLPRLTRLHVWKATNKVCVYQQQTTSLSALLRRLTFVDHRSNGLVRSRSPPCMSDAMTEPWYKGKRIYERTNNNDNNTIGHHHHHYHHRQHHRSRHHHCHHDRHHHSFIVAITTTTVTTIIMVIITTTVIVTITTLIVVIKMRFYWTKWHWTVTIQPGTAHIFVHWWGKETHALAIKSVSSSSHSQHGNARSSHWREYWREYVDPRLHTYASTTESLIIEDWQRTNVNMNRTPTPASKNVDWPRDIQRFCTLPSCADNFSVVKAGLCWQALNSCFLDTDRRSYSPKLRTVEFYHFNSGSEKITLPALFSRELKIEASWDRSRISH